MSLKLLKLANGMELIGHDDSVPQGCYDPITLTSAFIVIAQRLEPDRIEFGLAPISMVAADPTNIACTIAANQIIATLEPNDAIRDAHRAATGRVAIARKPGIHLAH